MNKKPEVGQWWVNVVGDPPRVHKTGIVLFVGRDSKGRILWEDCQGHIETDYGVYWSGWHHEPACTGWDWVPEGKEEFPQWYVSDKWEGTAYIKRVDAETAVRVALDGKEKAEKPWSTHEKECVEINWYTKTTQADAEARVTKKPTDLPVVEAKKTASVTVYEVVYGDNVERMTTMSIVGYRRLADLRGEWKYVSVVSTKTVEVML